MYLENVVMDRMMTLSKYYLAFKTGIKLFPQCGVWEKVSDMEFRFGYLGLVLAMYVICCEFFFYNNLPPFQLFYFKNEANKK